MANVHDVTERTKFEEKITKAVEERIAKAVPYKMPPISLGPCLWMRGPGHEAAPALVTRTGEQAISVILFPPESRAGVPKDGVRHISDPKLAKILDNDSGCWDYTDEQKRLSGFARKETNKPFGTQGV